MQAKRNLAHRMGRWSGTHPWTAILGWIAFVVVSFFVGSSVVTQKTLKESEQGVGESGRAAKVHRQGLPDEPDARRRDDPRPDPQRPRWPPPT